MSDELRSENARLAARVAELEAQLAAKPPINRASLYRMTDNAPWGVLAVNSDGGVDYANPAFQRWMMRTVPATGERLADAICPPLLARLEAPPPGALGGGAHEAGPSVEGAAGGGGAA